MTGALGIYAAALIVIGASVAIGAGILAATGSRQWSWTAPAVGLAAATVVAWWTVRLPGHGLTALIALALLSAAGVAVAVARLEGAREELLRGVPVAVLALLGASIPFVVEGHFGILGTGFNVDMSQHLFAADWLSDPGGATPNLFAQGYPLGPHALAVATGEVSGELATSFSGVTIAVPVVAALTALAGLREWPLWRATIAAALPAFAYLAASYLAQGSFKELFEATFVLGFALSLGSLGTVAEARRPALLSGVPGAVLGAGALYAYSGPGLVWLLGTLVLWAGIELFRRREQAGEILRRTVPATAVGIAVLAALAAPELDRIVDFGGSVGTVSDRAEASAGPDSLTASRGSSDGGERQHGREPDFDNDLGNLFGQISPLEAFGVWPTGDFRVAPGDGAMPAAAFYAGALLGALALALGLAAAIRRGETALLVALAAAAAIWLAARVASTPYTTAKALEVGAPLAMLIAARGVIDPGFVKALRGRTGLLKTAVAAVFVAGAALSSGLALANAPVGPGEYSPGVRELNEHFAGRPTLLLAPADVIADQHGREFYGWELREASPACVQADEGLEGDSPSGIRLVLTVDGADDPPFADLVRVAEADGVTLWKVTELARGRAAVTSAGVAACPSSGSA